ncbi:MAG: hypothetical protein IKN38_04415 [Clostridia bacterium]|nr:hypothetical protein [Clostridia bacterium]
MKKLLSAALTAVLLVSLLPLVSCSPSYEGFTYKDGAIVSDDGEKIFHPTPIGFQPCGIGEKCAVFDEAIDLFSVLDLEGNPLDTGDWMTEEYAGSASVVYYRDGIVIPPVDEIDFNVCYVCNEGNTVISVATITDPEIIDTIIDTAVSGRSDALFIENEIAEYTIKFHSDAFPGLFYSVTYAVCKDGHYIVDAGNDTAAEIGDILEKYVSVNGVPAN